MLRYLWLRKVSRRLFDRNPSSRRQRRTLRRAQLNLEPLEDRWCPSTFTVNSLDPTAPQVGSTGGLDAAVAFANANPGSTILFASSLSGGTINLDQTEVLKVSATITDTVPLTISGSNNAVRDFLIQTNAVVSITGAGA
jgi:hypothetical protein